MKVGEEKSGEVRGEGWERVCVCREEGKETIRGVTRAKLERRMLMIIMGGRVCRTIR